MFDRYYCINSQHFYKNKEMFWAPFFGLIAITLLIPTRTMNFYKNTLFRPNSAVFFGRPLAPFHKSNSFSVHFSQNVAYFSILKYSHLYNSCIQVFYRYLQLRTCPLLLYCIVLNFAYEKHVKSRKANYYSISSHC